MFAGTACHSAPGRSHPFTLNSVTDNSRIPALFAEQVPLHVIPALVLTLNSTPRAVIVQRLHYWLTHNAESPEHVIDGRTWVRFSYEELAADLQGLWKPETVGGHIRALMQTGVLERTDWDTRQSCYTLNYPRLLELAHKPQSKVAGVPLTVGELLEPRHTRLLYPTLARALGPGEAGINRALLLHQIFFWSTVTSRQKAHRGLCWVERPVRLWQKDFPFLSRHTLNAGLTYLADYGIVVRHKFRPRQRHTYSYALNTQFLKDILIPQRRIKEQPAETAVLRQASMRSETCTKPEKGTCTEPENEGWTEPEINKETTVETTSDSSTPCLPEPAPAATTSLSETKASACKGQKLIERQFNRRFLQELYREVPRRRAAWADLNSRQITDCYRQAQKNAASPGVTKKLGTLFREKLDTAAGITSVAAERDRAAGAAEAEHAVAAQERLKFADSCRNWVLDEHPGSSFDEHHSAAELIHAQVRALPLEHFTSPNRPCVVATVKSLLPDVTWLPPAGQA